MKPERIRFHDANLRPAWVKLLGRDATVNERVIALSVAIGETRAGDAWPGPDGIVGTADDERNKGATNLRRVNEDERIVIAAKGRELIAARPDVPQRDLWHDEDRLYFRAVGERGLPMGFEWILHKQTEPTGEDYGAEYRQAVTQLEAAALAPITPTVGKGHEERARTVNALLGEALPNCPAGESPAPSEKFPDGAYGTIHCDSHPGLGPFFVWFASFATPKPDDEDERDSWFYYLRILTRTGAEKAALASGDPGAMARAMYAAGYYGGFHVKDKLYESPKGSGQMVLGSELNIRDYTSVIARQVPSVRAAIQ